MSRIPPHAVRNDCLCVAYDRVTMTLAVQAVSIAVPLVSSTLLSRNIQHDVKDWCVRNTLEHPYMG